MELELDQTYKLTAAFLEAGKGTTELPEGISELEVVYKGIRVKPNTDAREADHVFHRREGDCLTKYVVTPRRANKRLDTITSSGTVRVETERKMGGIR